MQAAHANTFLQHALAMFASALCALPAVPLSRITGKAGEVALQGRGQRWAAKAGLCPGKSAAEPGRKLFHVHT